MTVHQKSGISDDPDPLTERVRALWTAGDFGRIARGYTRGAAEFVARLELAPDLPYKTGSFETVVSMFGAMFAVRPDRAASELLRVVRPGGRIVMANWTPTSFIGEMLATTARYVPPATDAPSPLRWGVEDEVRAWIGAGAASLAFTRRLITFEYPHDPATVVNEFIRWYGPTLRAYTSLDGAGRESLRRDLEVLWSENNRAHDGSTLVESEYLEVIAIAK